MSTTTTAEVRKPHVSATQIESYCRCGEAYRRRYLEHEVIPPGIVTIQGKGFHKAAEVNFSQKIESHVDLSVSDIKDAAAAAFEEEVRGSYVLTADEVSRGPKLVVAEAKDETVALAELHAREQAPDYQPIAVERECRIVFPNSTHDLLGFIDLEDDQDRVVDFKTANKRKNQDEVDASLQLTVYAAAHRLRYGRDASEVRLDTVVKNKKPVRQVLVSHRDQADFQVLVNRVNAVLGGLKAGIFAPATPGAWWCGPKWCGYWHTCSYVNNSKTVYSIGGIDE